MFTATKTIPSGVSSGERYLKRASESLYAKTSEHNIGHLFGGEDGHALLDECDAATRNQIVVQSQKVLTECHPSDDFGKTMFDQQHCFLKSIDLVGHVDADQPVMTTCFENLEQARMYLQDLNPVDIDRFEEDTSIPRTPEEKRLHVAVLFRAFKSTATAYDNQKQLKKFRDEQAFKYDNRKVEIMCWELLEDMIMRSSAGSLLRPHDSAPYRSERDNLQDMPFSERFDKVVDNLKKWKTTCRLVFEAPKGRRLVDDPDYSENRSKTNKACNNKRGVWQRAGRQLVDAQPTLPDSADEAASDEELSFNDVYNDSPSPPKRLKTSSVSTSTPTKSSPPKRSVSSKGRSAGKRSTGARRAARKDSSSDDLYTPSQRTRRTELAARRRNKAKLTNVSPSMPMLTSNFVPLSFNDNGLEYLAGTVGYTHAPGSLHGAHVDHSSQSSSFTDLSLVQIPPHAKGEDIMSALDRLNEFTSNCDDQEED